MSFTNQTTNYGLPQWIGTDKPTYLVDQNGAYATIDSELYTANSNAATAVSSAASAVEVAGTASTNAQTAIDSAATANTNANSAVATANTALTNASSALSLANTLQSEVASLSTVIDEHTYASTATNADVLNTAGTAIANALSTYPVDQYQYILTWNFSTNSIRTLLSREGAGSLTGVAALNATRDLISIIDTSGADSKYYTRDYASNGVTTTDISSNTIGSSLTVTIQVSKI